jgi:hypothetical protein
MMGFAAARPNIVFFLVDDMGWQETSVPFHTEVTALNRRWHTPNVERLATQGMRFTQAYASAVCSPTHISYQNDDRRPDLSVSPRPPHSKLAVTRAILHRTLTRTCVLGATLARELIETNEPQATDASG